MWVEFRVGEARFYGVPFEQFDDFAAFRDAWGDRVVPGKALLNTWDNSGGGWARPAGRRKLRIEPGVQCLCLDHFGRRDSAAEASMMARILSGLAVDRTVLKSAILDVVPASVFQFDVAQAVPGADRAARSWQVFGQARHQHFALRFPGGRLGDWALLSVATDFVLSRRPLPSTAAPEGDRPKARGGTLAERFSDMMAETRKPDSPSRPH